MASPSSGTPVSHESSDAVAPRSTSAPGVGRCSDDCSARRSPAGDHGVSAGAPAGTRRTSAVRSRGRNRSIGSTYRSPMRRPRWSTRPSWSVPTPPVRPTTSPRATGCPIRTPTDERNEYEVRRSPAWAMVTCSVPATATGEADDAVVGGAHGSARRGGEVDPAVPRGVVGARRIERLRHRSVHRSHPPAGVVRRGTGGAGGAREERADEYDEHDGEERAPVRRATCSTHGQPRWSVDVTTRGSAGGGMSTLPVWRAAAKGQTART